MDHAGQRLFVDEFRPGGRLMELDPAGRGRSRDSCWRTWTGRTPRRWAPTAGCTSRRCSPTRSGCYDLDDRRGQLAVDDLARADGGQVRLARPPRHRPRPAPGGSPPSTSRPARGRRWPRCRSGIDNVSVGPDDRIFVSHYVDGRVAEETGGRQRMLAEPGLLGPHGLALSARRACSSPTGSASSPVERRRASARLLTLLIELHTLALGVCEFGDDLFVLAAPGEVLVYRSGAHRAGRRSPRARRAHQHRCRRRRRPRRPSAPAAG